MTITRENIAVPVAVLEAPPLPRRQDRLPGAGQFAENAGTELRVQVDKMLARARAGADPRPARKRRRSAGAGGRRREHLHPGRNDRHDPGAHPAEARVRRDRRRDLDRRSRWSCSSTTRPPPRPRSSQRRCSSTAARGRRYPHLRQGRLPGDRRTSPAAPRST